MYTGKYVLIYGSEVWLQTGKQPMYPTLSAEWDHQIRPFALPPFTRLILADVDAGTDTPSFVGKVLQWLKENPDQGKAVPLTGDFDSDFENKAQEMWDALIGYIQDMAMVVDRMHSAYKEDPEGYRDMVLKGVVRIMSKEDGKDGMYRVRTQQSS